MYYSARRNEIYYYRKGFGAGSVGFPIVLYRYPSYLGVDILTVNSRDVPRPLLGFTDGRSIVIKDSLEKDVSDFVLLHEEEHVKDMAASEIETDKRALKKLVAKKAGGDKIKPVLELLEKRWKIRIPSADEFLR